MKMQTRFARRGLMLAALVTVGFGLAAPTSAQGLNNLKCDAIRIDIAGGGSMGAFTCYSKHTKKPLADPGSLKLAACLKKWGEKVGVEFDQIGDEYNQNGSSCTYDGLTNDFVASIGIFSNETTNAITDGVDVTDRADNTMRSILVKECGRYTDAILVAEAKNILKPDSNKLEGALAKARDHFLKKTAKAVKKGTKKGVDYTGPGPLELAAMVEEFAGDMVTALHKPEPI